MKDKLKQNEENKKIVQNFYDNIDCLKNLDPWINRFNLFDVLQISKTEIRHSNVIAWLLDPNENHGLKDFFILRFFNEISKSEKINLDTLDFKSFRIFREQDNYDILLVSEKEKVAIVIENKIEAGETGRQLQKYHTSITTQFKNFKYKKFVYLTPDGREPKNDVDNQDWICLSYQPIVDILERIYEKENLSEDVKFFIKSYLQTLRSNVVVDEELNDICKNIYSKYFKAMSLIMNIGEKLKRSSINTMLEEFSKENKITYDKETNYFYTPYLDKIFSDIKKDDKKKYRCKIIFNLKKEQFFLIVEVLGKLKNKISKNVFEKMEKLYQTNNKNGKNKKNPPKLEGNSRIYTSHSQNLDKTLDLEEATKKAIKKLVEEFLKEQEQYFKI